MINSSSVSKAFVLSAVTLIASVAATGLSLARGAMDLSALCATMAVLLTFVTLWLLRASNSIGKALSVMHEAANGNLSARVLGIRGHGNMGELLKNINRTLDQMEGFAKETEATMRATTAKRFYRLIQPRGFRGDFARYAGEINNTLAQMEGDVNRLAAFEARMLQDAVTISMTVNEGALANTRIVSGIQSAMTESQGMAAATEEMVSGFQTISANGNEVAKLSDGAQSMTDGARVVVDQAMREFQQIEAAVADAAERVSGLAASSEAIGEILTSIERIAAQTNLLALNATIESARAGEAGRGFAVVAQEVKQLSQQTANAAADISHRVTMLRGEMSGIVTTMQNGTESIAKGRAAMESMGGRMGDVSLKVSTTTHRISEISSVLNEQSQAANQISAGIQNIAHRADSNAKAVAASTKALAGLEKEMTSLLTHLAERDIPNKVLLLAKSDHVLWKKRLYDMLAGQAHLSADELSNEKSCRLGKWMQGPHSCQHHHDPAFSEIDRPHREVHQNGIEAVRYFNAGDYDNALKHIEQVEIASTQVLACLDRLIAGNQSGEVERKRVAS